jgi:hypothetical protein
MGRMRHPLEKKMGLMGKGRDLAKNGSVYIKKFRAWRGEGSWAHESAKELRLHKYECPQMA